MAYDGGSSLSTPALNRYAKQHNIDLTPGGDDGGVFGWINKHIIHGKPPGITQFNEALSPPDNDPLYGQFAQQSMRNFVGGIPRFVAGIPEALGAGGGGSNEQAAANGQGGGAGANKTMGKHPILRYIMRMNPDVTSLKQARKIRDDYQIQQAAPGLADFARQRTGQPDPNTMQMFFAQTVQPYLQQANQQFQQGANAGYAAMQKILANSANSPGLDVIRQFLPVQQAGIQQQAAALDAATRTAPAYDALLNQLNEAIQQQQRASYYQQALASGAGQQQSQPSNYAAALAGGSAQQATG